MSNKLNLLVRIYQDLDGEYTLHDAKEKARLFYKTAVETLHRDELGDIWVQISKEWDLNVWDADMYGDGTKKGLQVTLYPVEKKADGYNHTDESRPIGLTMWS